MVNHLRGLAQRRHLRRSDGAERGSLILDILIGMAIFALIAFIAATAVNQYRMRAYIQAAVSDATQTAHAVSAHLTDQVTNRDDADPLALISTTRELTSDDISTLRVNRTSQGGHTSAIWVIPGASNVEHFRVCVEYRGAFAIYDVDGGGMVDSGNMEKEAFPGCETGGGPWAGDDGSGPDAGGPSGPGGEEPTIPGDPGGDGSGEYLPCDFSQGPPALTAALYMPGDDGTFPGLAGRGLSPGDPYHPYQTGIAEEDWESERGWYSSMWYTAADVAGLYLHPQFGAFFVDAGFTVMATDLDGGACDFLSAEMPGGPGGPGDGDGPVAVQARYCDAYTGTPVQMPRYSAAEHGSIPELSGLSDGEFFMPWRHFGSMNAFADAVSEHRGTFWQGSDQRVLHNYPANWNDARNADASLHVHPDTGVLYEDAEYQDLWRFLWGVSDMVEASAGSGQWACPAPGAG